MAVLAGGIVLAMVGKVRAAAARSMCINNVRQIALAAHCHHDGLGAFPAGTMPNSELPPEQRLSWLMGFLPYLESDPTYKRTDKTLTWDADRNKPYTHACWPVFVCPMASDRTTIHTSYVGVAGVGPDAATVPGADPRAGVFGYDRGTKLKEITDGPAETLMLFETPVGGPWAQGGRSTVNGLDPDSHPYLGPAGPFGGRHVWQAQTFAPNRIGALAAMADGSYRFIRDEIDSDVLEALATIHGGESHPPVW
jgi:hypothetical protein